MLKRARVYICDHCGAVALEQTYCFYGDCRKGPPEHWTKLGDKDLCPTCTTIYRNFKYEVMEEKYD